MSLDLSKREFFAIQILACNAQGIEPSTQWGQLMVTYAVQYADRLIKELEKND